MTEILISAGYVFFVVAYLASSGTEAISSLFRWRATMLAKEIKELLNDKITGLGTRIYSNPLVNPGGPGDDPPEFISKRLPSYIDPTSFAVALTSALQLDQTQLNELAKIVKTDRNPSKTRERKIEEGLSVKIPELQNESRLRSLLATIIHLGNFDLKLIHTAVAQWFVQANNRLTGTYKRRVQLSNFLIALVIAVIFDLSPLPPGVGSLTPVFPASNDFTHNVSGSAHFAPPTSSRTETSFGSPGQDPTGLRAAHVESHDEVASDSSGELRSWAVIFNDTGVFQFIGWFITAIATVLGAPFWFGVLSKVTNVRGSGPAYDENKGTEPINAEKASMARFIVQIEPDRTSTVDTAPASPSPGGAPPIK